MTQHPAFSPAEAAALANLPHSELVDLAVELDILVPAQIDRLQLLENVLACLVVRARAEGLPLTPYDRDDLAELPPADRAALARLLGHPDDIEAILKASEKVCKRYRKERPRSAVALLLPSLLAPLARWAARG